MAARRAITFWAPAVAVVGGLAFVLTLYGVPPRTPASPPLPRPGAGANRRADAIKDAADAPGPGPGLTTVARTVQEGLSIALKVGQLDPKKTGVASFREGDDVVIGLELRDATTGMPITKARPAAWVVGDDEPGAKEDPRKAALLVKALIEARFFTESKIDLNVYYVLTLGEDSVSVVDPLYGFAGMKLLAVLPLGGRGYDWAFSEEQGRLFVSVPESDAVVVIDTRSRAVLGRVATPPRPTRIGVRPDGRSAWVACDGDAKAVGAKAACIDVESLRVVATADLGTGPHDLAFSDDGRSLIVTNARAGTVAIIDATRPRVAVALPTGRGPASVAYSAPAGQAWVAHADGRVVAIDPARKVIAATIPTGIDLAHIRFTPDGRKAVAVSPSAGRVLVFDATNARQIQQGKVDGEPDRVYFSDRFAYIRRRSSPMLRAISLDGLGFAGGELPGADLPMGVGPLGRMPLATPADSIVTDPGGGALLVVNSDDRSVHYYKEGMSAPMGSFRLRTGYPRATLPVDHSLQERHRPGFYETAVKLPEASDYKVVMYLDTPRVVHSFRLHTDADPGLAKARDAGRLDVAFPDPPKRAEVGEPVSLRFLVTDRTTKAPRADLADFRVQTLLVPGIWSNWQGADPRPGGWYEVRFRPVRAGVYYLFFECASVGLDPGETHRHVLYVKEKGGGAG